MEHLKGSHSGEQIGKDISTHADQILSILERRGIVEDQSIPSQKAREAEQELRHKPGNGEMMYNIISQTFLTPDKLTHNEILFRLGISDRHYYRLRQQAVNILSIRLWTAPARCLDAWLELLTLLEGD